MRQALRAEFYNLVGNGTDSITVRDTYEEKAHVVAFGNISIINATNTTILNDIPVEPNHHDIYVDSRRVPYTMLTQISKAVPL